MSSVFSTVDSLIFVFCLLLALFAGVGYEIYKRWTFKRTDPQSFLAGGHQNLPLIPTALSLLIAFQSSVVILGMTSEMYTRGTTYWWAVVGVAFSILVTNIVFVPVFHPIRMKSINEYLSRRFGSILLRKSGAVLHIFLTVLYLSIAMYAPCLALKAVTNWLPLWALITVAGSVSTCYVILGGMTVIIWIDVVWACLVVAGLLSLAIKGTSMVGGIDVVWNLARKQGRIVYFDYRVDPFLYMTGWSIIFGQLFSYLGWYGINQSAFQRYCGMATKRKAQAVLLLNIPAIFLFFTLVGYCGLTMFAYFTKCDPLQAGYLNDKDQLLPYFSSHVLANVPGLCGLFVACLYAATLSTVSAGLNSVALTIYEDFLKKCLTRNGWTDRKQTRLLRIICFIIGLLSTGLANLGPYMGGILKASLSALGALNGPLIGIFLLGVLVPCANSKGAITGAVIAMILSCWLCLGNLVTVPYQLDLPTNVTDCNENLFPFPEPSISIINVNMKSQEEPALTGISKLYGLSYCLYEVMAVIIVFLVAIPVSYFTGFQEWRKMDRRLFHPWVLSMIEPRTVCSTPEEVFTWMPIFTPLRRFDSFDPYCQMDLYELKKIYFAHTKKSRSF